MLDLWSIWIHSRLIKNNKHRSSHNIFNIYNLPGQWNSQRKNRTSVHPENQPGIPSLTFFIRFVILLFIYYGTRNTTDIFLRQPLVSRLINLLQLCHNIRTSRRYHSEPQFSRKPPLCAKLCFYNTDFYLRNLIQNQKQV